MSSKLCFNVQIIVIACSSRRVPCVNLPSDANYSRSKISYLSIMLKNFVPSFLNQTLFGKSLARSSKKHLAGVEARGRRLSGGWYRWIIWKFSLDPWWRNYEMIKSAESTHNASPPSKSESYRLNFVFSLLGFYVMDFWSVPIFLEKTEFLTDWWMSKLPS